MILRKEQQEFLARCLTLLETNGEWFDDIFILGKITKCIIYRDPIVYICRSENGLHLEVERLKNKTLLIMAQDGKIIKFAPEYVILEECINHLTEKMDVNLIRLDFPPEEPIIAML